MISTLDFRSKGSSCPSFKQWTKRRPHTWSLPQGGTEFEKGTFTTLKVESPCSNVVWMKVYHGFLGFSWLINWRDQCHKMDEQFWKPFCSKFCWILPLQIHLTNFNCSDLLDPRCFDWDCKDRMLRKSSGVHSAMAEQHTSRDSKRWGTGELNISTQRIMFYHVLFISIDGQF